MEKSFQKFLKSDAFTVKYAKGPSDRHGKEFHAYHEIIYFLGGTGEFICDDFRVGLRQNQIMIIPKARYHQLCMTGNEEDYHRCVIHFDNIPSLHELTDKVLDKITVFDADITMCALLDRVIELTKHTKNESIAGNVVFAVVILLLEKTLQKGNRTRVMNIEPLSHQCLALINRNLCGSLSVSFLAERLNLSPSALSHIFKKEMHISVYKYILEKRLVLAHEKILAGSRATEAAWECGFHDYSGFYKQYKKMFGVPPCRKMPVADIRPPQKPL